MRLSLDDRSEARLPQIGRVRQQAQCTVGAADRVALLRPTFSYESRKLAPRRWRPRRAMTRREEMLV
jgi:hypothetical protein